MFDFQISKHPHYDEAIRAFAQRHEFTPPELWLLTGLTEDSTLVDGFLAYIHRQPCVPVNELAKDKLQSYVTQKQGESWLSKLFPRLFR